MERVFDPFVADLQAEWAADRTSGRIAFARWRLMNAYGALVIQIIACAFGSLRGFALVPAAAAVSPTSPAVPGSSRSSLFRYCAPPLMASVLTFGLFALMSYLIAQQPGNVSNVDEFSVTFMRVPSDPMVDPVPPRPVLPEPPIVDRVPTDARPGIIDPIGLPRTSEIPEFNMGALPLAGAEPFMGLQPQENRQPSPIVRVNPVYPPRPLQRGTEGWVEVEFTITEAGGVSDSRVTNSQPGSVFDRAALRAVDRWKYEPMLVDGQPAPRPGVRTRILFQLNAENRE
jgi:protein TonB